MIGFDISEGKVELYKSGIYLTKEVWDDVIKETTVEFTADESKLKEAKFHVVAIPTPVNADPTPDLRPVKSASRTVGRNLTKGSIFVFESTLYPGVTQEICVPILEKESGMKCGEDFKGDSDRNEDSLNTIHEVFEVFVDDGVYETSSIKAEEAAKVKEMYFRQI